MNTPNPFLLWDNYSKKDISHFFGRESEINALKSKLENGYVIFYGSSGSGKSSVCKAGLLYDYYFEDYSRQYLVNLIGYEKYFDALKEKIKNQNKPLLIFDQFEKIFYDNTSDTSFIISLINEYLKNNSFNFVIIIREENIGDLLKFSSSNSFSLLSDNLSFYLHKMERTKIIDVLIKIFKSVDIELCKEKSELIINTVYNISNCIELADIQIFGYEIIEAGLNINNIDSLKISEILDGFYEKVYNNLKDEQKAILKKGISSKGERVKINPDQTNIDAIKELLKIRLIKQIGNSYEITHDYLLKMITLGLSSIELKAIRVRELIERAFEDYAFNKGLYIDSIRLNEIFKFKDKIDFSYEQCLFITKSALKNETSSLKRNFWLKKLSDYYPYYLSFYKLILSLDNEKELKTQSENQQFILEIIKELFVKNQISFEEYFFLIKISLKSSIKDVVLSAINTFPNIDKQILKSVIELLINAQFYMFPYILTALFEKDIDKLLYGLLKEWCVSDDEENIKIAFDYFKENNISPDEIKLIINDTEAKSYLYYISYLAKFGETDKIDLKLILNKLFSFDKNLIKYVEKKIAHQDKKNELFNFLAKYLEPPFNVVFKNEKDFFSYEESITLKDKRLIKIEKGPIVIKDYISFNLILFKTHKLIPVKDDENIYNSIINSNLKNIYVVDFSNLDITSSDICVTIIKSLSETAPCSKVFVCGLSVQAKKKFETFSYYAKSVNITWII